VGGACLHKRSEEGGKETGGGRVAPILDGEGMRPPKPVKRGALSQSPQVSIKDRRTTHQAGGRGEASEGPKQSPRARGRS
jgi:hypothetical protein